MRLWPVALFTVAEVICQTSHNREDEDAAAERGYIYEPVDQILGPQPVMTWSNSQLLPQPPRDWLRLLGAVGTVCITGDDRIGKSTLLTAWSRNLTSLPTLDFPAGHTRTSHTKGLWSAVLPRQSTGLDYHLNLCDSQGPKQVSEVKQWRLFTANVLIPQVLVYMGINVIQNDELRDLAKMAHQFDKISKEEFGELGRFGRLLSPHLIVVVRDESLLDGDDDTGQDSYNLTAHLEGALAGPDFAEDKALIKRVFHSREAWVLERLPSRALKALRTGKEMGSDGEGWQRSGAAILQRLLHQMEKKKHTFLSGGPELAEWYRSVAETVNSDDQGSLGRLIGHGEVLDRGRRRQEVLRRLVGPAFGLLGVVALVLAFSGVVSIWLQRLAWLAWIILSVCYLGSSPLIKTPLSGLLQNYCHDTSWGAAEVLVRSVCLEVSSQTAAVLLAAVLGTLSYPLLTGRIRWLLASLPLPGRVHDSGATLALVGIATVLWQLQGLLVEVVFGDGGNVWVFVGIAGVAVSAADTGYRLMAELAHNRHCLAASESGIALHYWVSNRIEQVANLEQTASWDLHFRKHGRRNALWPFRSVPNWHLVSQLCQSLMLIVWACLIYPHCDVVVALGVSVNLLHLAWRLFDGFRAALAGQRAPEDETDAWADGMEVEDCSDADAVDDADVPFLAVLPESEEELETRRRIEAMRQAQEINRIRARGKRRNI
eukprot:TRINITY_DN26950_c0_g1_i2.p1 TRINITY_DN26950_c0_g1~~TRINITY_DN26950_c0_g1_i2.p1  ORF type:complete len:712 (+),score=120.39 TRINITY_DN26950_c0_g1_i2:90-2225(+)